MEKEFVPYKQALQLKELGFDEECLKKQYHHENDLVNVHFPNDLDCQIPLYQQAFRWFREKYEVKVISVGGDNIKKFNYLIYLKDNSQLLGKKCNTYEEAELACLIKLIEIVK
jgi:hypothetical protein